MKNLIALLLTLAWFTSQAQYAPKQGSNQVIQYSHFTVSYSQKHKQPEWVYYMLTKSDLKHKVSRSDNFRVDKLVFGSATPDEYVNTGFDRGHLSPAADNTTRQSNSESFYMSNMSPQLPSFNREIWSDLEEFVRKTARKFDTVYVVTGPVFVNNLGIAGTVTIPGYYYKCLLVFKDGKPSTIGFIVPHINCVAWLEYYVVPVNTVETLTGFDFFPGIAESAENSMSKKRWR